jgi:hypothetical protein
MSVDPSSDALLMEIQVSSFEETGILSLIDFSTVNTWPNLANRINDDEEAIEKGKKQREASRVQPNGYRRAMEKNGDLSTIEVTTDSNEIQPPELIEIPPYTVAQAKQNDDTKESSKHGLLQKCSTWLTMYAKKFRGLHEERPKRLPWDEYLWTFIGAFLGIASVAFLHYRVLERSVRRFASTTTGLLLIQNASHIYDRLIWCYRCPAVRCSAFAPRSTSQSHRRSLDQRNLWLYRTHRDRSVRTIGRLLSLSGTRSAHDAVN